MPGENIADWSTTAITNGTADSLINWAEGQARASVNDSARSMMAAIAKDRNLKNGSIVTGGTANAQTFASGLSYTSMPAALRVLLKIGPLLTNNASATLNMDGIGPFTIYNQFSQTLTPGILRADSYAEFLWQGTSWILINVPPAASLTNVRTFTATGTYPTTSANVQVFVMCKAGGGGGATSTGSAGGGGGGEGAIAWKLTTAAALSAQAVTIGAAGAGAGAVSIAAGSNGGISSIGSIVSAGGGAGGTAGTLGGTGGLGGLGTIGDWIDNGIPGEAGGDVAGTSTAFHASGGGRGGGTAAQPNAAANSGAGGANGVGANPGGNGGTGVVLCYEYGTI